MAYSVWRGMELQVDEGDEGAVSINMKTCREKIWGEKADRGRLSKCTWERRERGRLYRVRGGQRRQREAWETVGNRGTGRDRWRPETVGTKAH